MNTNATNTPSLLLIDVSPRSARSHSRTLSRDYVQKWKAAHAGARVVVEDLTQAPPPFVSEAWVEGAFNAPANRSAAASDAMKVSDKYVDELVAASEIVISTPIYNLGVPAVLKAWIDQIVRFGRTFSIGADGSYQGLVADKSIKVIVASGGDFRPTGAAGAYNHVEPYLRAVFGFIGITNVSFIYAHSLNNGDDQREKSLSEARRAVELAAAN